jgi:hypothetical protein
MLYRLRQTINQALFDFKCRHILGTPPISADRGSAVVVSMLCHRDVRMYLVAIKSFLSHYGPARVAILDDGTLTDRDRATLNHHLPSISFAHVADIDLGPCPTNACFERLLFIADLVQDNYVIELDADTVTTGDIAEIVAAADHGRSFILGTMPTPLGSSIVPIRAAFDWVLEHPSNHPQSSAERRFDRLEQFATLKYVRGSAALVGFARGSFSRQDVHRWSIEIEGLVGREVWWVWGAEQTIVNLIVANTPDGLVLPFGKYVCHPEDDDLERCSFMHFYSPYRFESGVYSTAARRVASRIAGA